MTVTVIACRPAALATDSIVFTFVASGTAAAQAEVERRVGHPLGWHSAPGSSQSMAVYDRTTVVTIRPTERV